ncbi:MAG TPA: zinc-binding dehydrogenase [Anaerolineales bacterium]|nr:zinc-binding dehydrogenase [Anaerolineales bacterium]
MRAIYIDKNIPRALTVKYLRRLWPGVVWSPLSHARVVEMPEPALPGPRWLRVRTRQCGICASDLSLLLVKADPAAAPLALPGNERFYLGHEVVGEVVEVGPQVRGIRPGQRVVMESRFTGPTCFTQEIDPPCRFCAAGDTRLCENASLGRGPTGVGGGWGDGYTAHESEVRAVPDGLDDDQASLVEPMAVALHGVLRRPPRDGEHVLIVGAGIIGLLTAQCVKLIAPESHLTVLARYPHQAEAARRLGAEAVLGGSDLYAQAAERTGAKLYRAPLNRGMLLGGFDLIYDCVGGARTIYDSLRWARAQGTVVLVGIDLALLRVDLNPVWYQEVDLIGSHTFGAEHGDGRPRHTFELVIEHLRAGRLSTTGLITHRFPLAEYRTAINTALHKKSGSIKVTFMI